MVSRSPKSRLMPGICERTWDLRRQLVYRQPHEHEPHALTRTRSNPSKGQRPESPVARSPASLGGGDRATASDRRPGCGSRCSSWSIRVRGGLLQPVRYSDSGSEGHRGGFFERRQRTRPVLSPPKPAGTLFPSRRALASAGQGRARVRMDEAARLEDLPRAAGRGASRARSAVRIRVVGRLDGPSGPALLCALHGDQTGKRHVGADAATQSRHADQCARGGSARLEEWHDLRPRRAASPGQDRSPPPGARAR